MKRYVTISLLGLVVAGTAHGMELTDQSAKLAILNDAQSTQFFVVMSDASSTVLQGEQAEDYRTQLLQTLNSTTKNTSDDSVSITSAFPIPQPPAPTPLYKRALVPAATFGAGALLAYLAVKYSGNSE